AAFRERRVVARGLGAQQPAEAERAAGDRELVARVVDDLEEQAGIRTPFVQLAGRMEVARAPAVRDDESGTTTKLAREIGHPALILLVRVHECLNADVVPLVRLLEQAVDRAR